MRAGGRADSLSRFCSTAFLIINLEPRHPALAPRLRHLHAVEPSVGSPPPIADSGLALEEEAANGLGQTGKVPPQICEGGGVDLGLESLFAAGLCLDDAAEGGRGRNAIDVFFATASFGIVLIVSP